MVTGVSTASPRRSNVVGTSQAASRGSAAAPATDYYVRPVQSSPLLEKERFANRRKKGEGHISWPSKVNLLLWSERKWRGSSGRTTTIQSAERLRSRITDNTDTSLRFCSENKKLVRISAEAGQKWSKWLKRNIFNKWFRKQKVTEKDSRRREDIEGSKRWEVWIRPPSFLVNTGPIWSVKEEGCPQQQKSQTLELRGKKGRGHKEVAWRMAAVAGSVQDTQATQLQLLVLHQLYKPYISGEFALLFIKSLEWNTQTEKPCILLSFVFPTVFNETHRKLS